MIINPASSALVALLAADISREVPGIEFTVPAYGIVDPGNEAVLIPVGPFDKELDPSDIRVPDIIPTFTFPLTGWHRGEFKVRAIKWTFDWWLGQDAEGLFLGDNWLNEHEVRGHANILEWVKANVTAV